MMITSLLVTSKTNGDKLGMLSLQHSLLNLQDK